MQQADNPPVQPQPPYYNPLPPLAPLPSRDDGDLRLLSILEYVYAGFLGFAGLICIVYIVIGAFVARMPMPAASTPGRHGGAPLDLEALGTIFIVVGILAMIIAWAKAVLLLVSARSMSARKRHTLCIVTAALTCISFPLGTALGVFTLIVLLRPSVRALFT